MRPPSRIETGRRRAQTAKRGVAVVAAASFVVALLLARESHPGHGGTGSTATSSSDETANDDGLALTPESFGSSSSALPQVQTHVS
jgi:hypothetical protein